MTEWFVAVTAGKWQVCGIKAAIQLGYKVVAIDGNEHAEGFNYANESICLDLDKTDDIIAALTHKNIVGCLSVCSDAGMLLAGQISDYFDLPSVRFDVAKNLTNKGLQRTFWRESTFFLNPKFVIGNNLTTIINQAKSFTFPLILKPVDSAGSRGVSKLDCIQSLNQSLFDEAMQYSKSKEVIVEEFINGKEYTVETLLENGELHLLAITKKYKLPETNYTVAYKLETVHFNTEITEKICTAIKQAYGLIGYHNGVGHAEIILTEQNEIAVVEVAGRGGGFLLFEKFIPYITSVPIVKLAIQQACGQPIHLTEKTNHFGILEFLPSSKGTVKSITGFASLKDFSQCDGDSFVSIGDKVQKADCDGARLGYVISYGGLPDKVKDIAETAINSIEIEVIGNYESH